mgnify:CR=1 FL=1
MELVNLVLQNEGITDGSQLLVVDPTKLGEEFGVDAVMFVTIDEWGTSYFVVGGSVEVALKFSLLSTKSGEQQ